MPNYYRSAAAWQFSIDKYLNRFIVPSFVKHLPTPVAYFCGYRSPSHTTRKIGNLVVVAWAFVGVFCGVSVVNVVDSHIRAFRANGGTNAITVGSFGAAAVLEFYAIESPLAQPRNAVFGQVLSSLVGVAVARLFSLAGPARFHTLRWLAGSIACAAATAVMALTGTVHPPAGATALIAVADDHIYNIGWYLIPAVLLGSVLMQCIALIINNIQRRYPTYWWSPEEVGQFYTCFKTNKTRADKLQSTEASSKEESLSGPIPAVANDAATVGKTDPEAGLAGAENPQITITKDAIIIPYTLNLKPDEHLLLETLRKRL